MNEKKLINPNAPADFTPSQNSYETTDRVSLFRMFCYENFPYIEQDFDAVTTYQLLQKVVEYLNKVIKNLNITENNLGAMGENVAHLYNAYVQLQDYVNNYFDNLDVQAEINIKLDEMVADGTLDNILNNYLEITKVYNTMSDLKSDSINMVNNMNCKTLGYYSINDGGSATYKITNVKSDTEYQEDIGNGLFATLIIKDYLNLNSIGVSDKLEDNSVLINKGLQFASTNKIMVKIEKQSIYKILSPIIITNNVYIDFNNSTIIKDNNINYSNINTIIYIKKSDSFEYNFCEDIQIKNVVFNGKEKNDFGIYIEKAGTKLNFENVSVQYCKKGIKTNNIWVCSFRKIYLLGCSEIGFDCGINGTTITINECYAFNCNTGYRFEGIIYSTLSNLACDACTNTCYEFVGSTLDITSLGSESVKAKKIISCINANININSGNLFVNETDPLANVISVNGSILNLNTCNIGLNSKNNIQGRFIDFPSNGNVILNSCKLTNNKFLTPNKAGAESSLIINNNNRAGCYTGGRYSVLPIINKGFINEINCTPNGKNIKNGNIWFNVFNNPITGLDEDLQWKPVSSIGDVFINQSNNTTGISMFQQKTLEEEIKILNPIVAIDGNTLKFDNITYDNIVNLTNNQLTPGTEITSKNGASAKIESITSNTIVINNLQGNFNIGDYVYKTKKPIFARDVKYAPIQQILYGNSSSRPKTNIYSTGIMYFDLTLNKPIWWNGSKWVDCNGQNV